MPKSTLVTDSAAPTLTGVRKSALDTPADGGIKKPPVRWKPDVLGRRAVAREMKRSEKHQVIPCAIFERVVRATSGLYARDELRFQGKAMKALQHGAEAFIVDLMAAADRARHHSGQKILLRRHFLTAKEVGAILVPQQLAYRAPPVPAPDDDAPEMASEEEEERTTTRVAKPAKKPVAQPVKPAKQAKPPKAAVKEAKPTKVAKATDAPKKVTQVKAPKEAAPPKVTQIKMPRDAAPPKTKASPPTTSDKPPNTTPRNPEKPRKPNTTPRNPEKPRKPNTTQPDAQQRRQQDMLALARREDERAKEERREKHRRNVANDVEAARQRMAAFDREVRGISQ